MNVVITIGRKHGSGGRHIGKIIAEKLGIECYDIRFITEAAERNGINEKVFIKTEPAITNTILDSGGATAKTMIFVSTQAVCQKKMPLN